MFGSTQKKFKETLKKFLRSFGPLHCLSPRRFWPRTSRPKWSEVNVKARKRENTQFSQRTARQKVPSRTDGLSAVSTGTVMQGVMRFSRENTDSLKPKSDTDNTDNIYQILLKHRLVLQFARNWQNSGEKRLPLEMYMDRSSDGKWIINLGVSWPAISIVIAPVHWVSERISI